MNLSFIKKLSPLLFLIVLPSVLPARTPVLSLMATVEEIDGTLKIQRKEQTQNAKVGASLYPGDELKTSPKGRALLRLVFGETLIQMAPKTVVRIPDPVTTHLFLSQGFLWGKRTAKGAPLFIETPVMVIGVRGTEFFIRVEGPGQVVVLTREGTVEANFGGETVSVGPMTVGYFEKEKGSRLIPAHESILKDWEAPFKSKDSFRTT